MKKICNLHKPFLIGIVFFLAAFGAQAQKTYLVAVGLDEYDPRGNCTYLPTSVNDVRSLARFFDSYNNSDVFMLKNDNATRDHILRVLKSQFAKSGPEDEIIFAYSGHGFDGGLSCYDAAFPGQTNIVFCSEIQEILRNAKARRKVMFINSCHSGSFTKKYGSDPRAKSYKNGDSNVMICMSSRADEESWTTSEMSMSYYYTALLRALRGAADANRDSKVTARELFNYVYGSVLDMTGGIQHPQMYGKFPDDMVVVYVK